jgi:glycosyltransferase involved in cell wall biosynthesis
VPRNRRIIEFLKSKYEIVFPWGSEGRTLGANLNSLLKILAIGGASLSTNCAIHFDVIDVFASPFLRNKRYILDIRCPVPIELKWLGYNALAQMVEPMLKRCVNDARIMIAASDLMLDYAHNYGKCQYEFVIPNCPSRSINQKFSKDEARKELGIDSAKQMGLFLTSGRLRKIYGIDLLISTWMRVRKNLQDSALYIVGPFEELGLERNHLSKLRERGIFFTGQVNHETVAMWILASDVCLSQRTPGFPTRYYNHQDSLKISEYAALRKPIVAAGYAASPQYISAKQTPEGYSEAILEAFLGNAPVPNPSYWEDNKAILTDAYDILMNESKK